MSVRRPFARYNRGRIVVPRAVAAAAPSIVVPLLASNCLTYLHADSGPVGTPSTAVGNDVTNWISLTDATGGGGPYDWDQTGASDRGVIDETTFSGGRRSVRFDGISDHMFGGAALAAEFAGTQIPFTRFLHAFAVSQTALDYVMAIDASATSTSYELIRDFSGSDGVYQWLSRGGATIPSALTGGNIASEEFIIVDIKHGATRSAWVVTAGGGAVKVIDGAAFDAGTLSGLDVITLAARYITSLLGPSHIAVRRHGLWNLAINDTQAGTLTDLFGT